MYLLFKNLHAAFAVVSFIFLLLRISLAWSDGRKLNSPWSKTLPHIVDGLLVVSIICLLITSHTHPFSSSFHTEKFVGFLSYIIFSVLTVLTLRGRFSAKLKLPFAALAILSWFWLIKVAVTKQGFFF